MLPPAHSAKTGSCANVIPSAKRSLWIRIPRIVIAVLMLGFLAVIATIYFRQHSMLYHPRLYDESYARALPPNGVEIRYTLSFGNQVAYYVPGTGQTPKHLWVAFCGNGSLALDWITILRGYPRNEDGFLLIDYPGYGRNAGYATIESTRASANAAFDALARRLGPDSDRINLCVIGHSLGAAAALDFAGHHRVERVLLISPFTTLREEAAQVVGRQLSWLLIENYDNRANLEKVFSDNPQARVSIFHGTDDHVIPVWMGRKLKQEFPVVDFFPVEGGDHVSVIDIARDQIIEWMTR